MRPFCFSPTRWYTPCLHDGVRMKLVARRELLLWLTLFALAIGPFLVFPDFHGNALEVCLYWLWQSFLLGIAICLTLRLRRVGGPLWLRAVGTTVLVCMGVVGVIYFIDWAAWYK